MISVRKSETVASKGLDPFQESVKKHKLRSSFCHLQMKLIKLYVKALSIHKESRNLLLLD